MDLNQTGELLEKVSAQLDEKLPEAMKTGEEALKEAKNAGKISEETAAKVDAAVTDVNKMASDVRSLTEKLEGLDGDLSEAVQNGFKAAQGGQVQSFKDVVLADEGVKAFMDGTAEKASFSVSNEILQADLGSMVPKEQDMEIGRLPRRRLTVIDLISRGETESNSVFYTRQTLRSNAAAGTAENTASPASDYQWSEETAPVRDITHHVPVSKNSLDDAPMFAGELNDELIYGVDLKEEVEVLSGTGVGQTLSGLVTNAVAYAKPAGTPAEDFIADRLRLAMVQLMLSDGFADGVVLNPVEASHFDLHKTTGGEYVSQNPYAMTGPMIWGTPRVDTPSMAQGTWLVGDFRRAAKLWRRAETEVQLAYEDSDNFKKRMVTAQAVKRVALGVKVPSLLITGNATFA